MRTVILILWLSMYTGVLAAQELKPILFHGQPTLEKGIQVEAYARYYEDPSGDTLQPLNVVERQRFVPSTLVPQIHSHTNKQMPRTSQVIWLQFRISNAHPTDTLHLWYVGGIHAVVNLYEKKNGSFQYLGNSGLCTPGVFGLQGYDTLSMNIPPQSTSHYFVRVADYLLLLGDVAGQLHTQQSFQWFIARELLMAEWLLAAMALILGGMLLMSGYSLFGYLLNHDRAFLYYSLYTTVAGCYIIVLANPRFSLGLTPSSLPWLGHPVALSFNHLLALLYGLFIITLLDIPRKQPRFWLVFRLLMVVLALLQGMAFIQVFYGVWMKSNLLYMMLDTLPALFTGMLLIGATLRSESKLSSFLLAGQISLYVIAISPLHGNFFLNHLSPQASIFFNYPPL
jgi:hypothetical protein